MSTRRLTLTFEQALEGLRAAVADRGEDFRYRDRFEMHRGESCANFMEGEPACIAGHVYAQHGITPDDDWETSSVDRLADASEWGDGEERLTVELDAYRLLAYAQTLQDEGRTWGDALKGALREVGR